MFKKLKLRTKSLSLLCFGILYVLLQACSAKFNNSVEDVSSVIPSAHTCSANDPPVKFLDQKFPPGHMQPGQVEEVSMSIANCSGSIWKKGLNGSGYFLGARIPQDSTQWGTSRVALPMDVRSGQKIKLTFSITAPVEGNYAYQWGLLHEGVKWLPPFSPPALVTVGRTLNCTSALSKVNSGQDAREVLQECINLAPANTVLEVPPGIYTLYDQLIVQKTLTLRTTATAGNRKTCLSPGAPACAEFKAASVFPQTRVHGWGVTPESGSWDGLIRVAKSPDPNINYTRPVPDGAQIPNVAFDHIILNGNRANRLDNFNTAADSNEFHFLTNAAMYSHGGKLFFSASINSFGSTGFGMNGDRAVMAYNLFANNGTHFGPVTNGLTATRHSDGLTVNFGRDDVIMYNTFRDNTDIDLIVGNAPYAFISFNTIEHQNLSEASFGGMMLFDWQRDELGMIGAEVSYNKVDCGFRCGFGLMIGGTPWTGWADTSVTVARIGSIHHNTIISARQGINISHGGTSSSPIYFDRNSVLSSGGYPSLCNTTGGKFNLSLSSVILSSSNQSTPDSNYTWPGSCSFDFNYYLPASSAPAAPTGLKATCDTLNNLVTLSWKTVSTVDRYYLRVAAPANLQLDNFTASSYTMPIVPGQDYHWWLHAGNSATAGDAVGANFRCDP